MENLQKGSTGSAVLQLQQALKGLGYDVGTDGIFGNETHQAVLLFQKDNGLAEDGIAGINTWAVIKDLQSSRPVMGIDVSHHNGVINWNLVPRNLVQFVFCKASQGKTFRDPMLATHFNELKRLNFIRGAYHFLTFQGATAAEQVSNFTGTGIHFLQPGTLPPVLDVEWQQSSSLNQYIQQNRQTCIQLIRDWLQGVETATGRKPIIYTAKAFWNDYLGNPPGFETYGLWVASYRNDAPLLPGLWNDYTFWQYTESGAITGITGQVDRNYFNGALNKLNGLALM